MSYRYLTWCIFYCTATFSVCQGIFILLFLTTFNIVVRIKPTNFRIILYSRIIAVIFRITSTKSGTYLRIGQRSLGMDWKSLYADRMRLINDTSIISLLKLAERPDVISFAGGLPDPGSFPIAEIKEATDWVIDHEGPACLQYGPTAGYTRLREWIAGRMGQIDQADMTADNILVTTGGLEAIDLISKAFIDAGDTVVVEAPSYLAALHTFRSYEAQLVDVPTDRDGMDIDALEVRLDDLARGGIRPKFIYTIATFQNPGGVSLSMDRRRRLVALADRYGIPILEDAPYAELRYEGETLPSLVSLNPDGVIYVNTFSKIFGPGIRLGWIAAPPETIVQFCQCKQGTDQCSSTIGQRIVYEYGNRGMINRQVADSIPLYREKRDRTLRALETMLPPGVKWTHPAGGFYLWVTLPDGVKTVPMLSWGIEHEKVAYVAGPPFYIDGRGENQFRLCYSFLETDQIEEGIGRLSRVIEHHTEQRHHSQMSA